MPKPRKMLGAADSPYIVSLMRLIETQSKATIAAWCIGYAEAQILPIYAKTFPHDRRPFHALQAARDWMDGKVKLPEVKRIILQECHAAAREAEDYPAAQAAARTCGQAAACIHTPTHSLGLAFTVRRQSPTTGSAQTNPPACTTASRPKTAQKWKTACGGSRWKTSPTPPKSTGIVKDPHIRFR